MRYTRLGSSGLQVSRLCFGTNSVGKPGHLGAPRRRVSLVEEGTTQTVVGLIW